MSKTLLIMISDNPAQADAAKKYWEGHDVQIQVYSPMQWRDGLENSFFRQQLSAGVPALASGLSPVVTSDAPMANVIQFPTNSPSSNVQKMEQMEAQAIENAIAQYKGNLTEAARALGIGRATLYRKVKQYHIDPSVARKKKVIAA